MPDAYDPYLPGIQYAETRGQANPQQAVGDQGRSRGAYQIQPVMYQDIQQTYPQRWKTTTYEQMLASPELQSAVAHDGLKMLHERYGLSGDAMVSGWNTGPGKARKGFVNKAYVDTVKRGMKGNPLMRRFQ